jgi:hypothetical protein
LTPACTAAAKGGSSMRRSRASSCGRIGVPWCESVEVSPWPGKCFAQRRLRRLQAFDHRRAQASDERWVFAKRSRADDRISRIDVDVAHRRVIDVDAHRGEFAPDSQASLARQLGGTGRAQRLVAR